MTQQTTDLHTLGVSALSALLRERKLGAVEAAQHFLARAQAHQNLGAFVSIDEEATLAQARAADALIAQGKGGRLAGVPIAHKDIFVTRDFPTTASSKMLAGYRSPFDATVVTRLAEAGAVTLGKLNCDEFAMGSANENSAVAPVGFDAPAPVRNPWNLDRVPGGSSGGSAVAVAAGLAPAVTGTDTGGSIRQPASFCGITGIKPTYGRASRYGMIAFASSLDQAGPMGKSAEDCALLLSDVRPRPGPRLHQPGRARRGLHGPPERRHRRPAHRHPRRVLRRRPVGRRARRRGWRAQGIREAGRPPGADLAAAHRAVDSRVLHPGPGRGIVNLSRFDGVKFGHRAKDYTDLVDMYKKTRAEGFGDEVKRRIMIGAYVLSEGYYDAYYLQAQKIRRMIADDFQAAFQQCDVIAGPAAPTVAWQLGGKSDPLANYLADIFTLPASLAGLPGMSVPAGFGEAGMPVGLQLIGNYFKEGQLLNAAHRFQQATDFHLQAPKGI